MSLNIAFITDAFSYDKANSIFKTFMMFSNTKDINIIPLLSEASEDEIITTLSSIFYKDYDLYLGLTSSGNGLSIFANKLHDVFAASINNMDEIAEAISLKVNCFDVSVTNTEASSIFAKIIKDRE